MNQYEWFEKEEAELVELLNNGEITEKQYNEEIRELRYNYKFMAEEAASEAYHREMENWYA